MRGGSATPAEMAGQFREQPLQIAAHQLPRERDLDPVAGQQVVTRYLVRAPGAAPAVAASPHAAAPVVTRSGLSAVTPTAYLEWVDWATPIVAEPIRIRDGQVPIPHRPGAVIAWNEGAVKRYEVG